MKNTIFDKDDAENGKMIETKNARNGGYLVGRSHKNGGIKGVNVDTGDPIEVEGGEVVITKPAVESNKYYTLNGKKMKPKEILSKLNSDHGGVAFAQGGKVGGDKYLMGGVSDDNRRRYFYERNSNPPFMVRSSNDDLDYELYRFLGSKKLADGEIGLSLKGLINNSESTYEFIDCLKAGDIFYIKGMRKVGTMEQSLSRSNPNVEFDFAEIPFILTNVFSNDGTVINTLVFQRTYIDENGNEKNEVFDWVRSDYSFANDDVIAVPKINNESISTFLGDDNYNNNPINSQDFLNGKFVLYLEEAMCKLTIAGYGIRENSDKEVTLQVKTWESGITYTGLRAYTEGGGKDYPIANYDGYVVAVGDVWEIEYSNTNAVGSVEFVQENLAKQKLSADGIYVFPYAKDTVEAKDYQLFYSDDLSRTVPTDPTLTNSDILIRQEEVVFGKDGLIQELVKQVVRIIGFILPKKERGTFSRSCFDFLVENVETGEKFIVSYPVFKRPVKMVTAENYGQPIIQLSDEQKEISKVKKKDERNSELYELLIDGLNQEEAKLIVMKSLLDPTNIAKNLNIDRRLNEITTLRDQYKLDAQTALNLIDQFETVFYVEKSTQENPFSATSINGQPTQLTETQYKRVYSPEFIEWFGDWITAYELGDYTGVSKVINPVTAEPYVLFHGTDADFTAWKFNDFPVAYFGNNKSYSEWFANQKSSGGEGHMYECFISMKNPIDMRQYALDNHRMGDILNYLEQSYGLNPKDIVPELKNITPEQYETVMNVNLKAWQFVRRGVPFLNYVKENTFYDGILMFEDNPQDIVNGEPNTTGSYVVFREGQIKWAGASFFNTIISDNRFAKGGKVKSLTNKYNSMDFVF
jgi:hypothetical protein